MRVLLLALVALSLVPVPAAQAGPGPATFAVGEVSYHLEEEGGVPPSCSGHGVFTVTFQADAGRLLVAGSALGCVPVWSLISQCHYLPDGTVRCFHDGIDITLAPDGRFDYVWDGPGFYEEMHGLLTRVA